MKVIPLALFLAGLAWLAYVYFGYPILLWILGVWKRFKPESRDDYLPSVSVLISARNEEKDIGWKIAETLNWDYPQDRLDILVASDASEDRTDETIRAMCGPRVALLRLEQRVGKNEALNRLSQMARGDLLFFTDANSHIQPDCLRRMVRHFADARVGCVTGTDRTMKESSESAIGAGEKTYWGYESQLQRLESRLGSVLICFGAIFCIRRSLYTPLQADLANDLELPIRIGGAGHAVLFEPDAFATEKATHSPKEEFNRRRRICGQGALGFWRLRKTFRGMRAWQFISRKLLRWLALAPLALLLGSSLAMASHPLFRAILAAQLFFYAMALLGWVLTSFRGGDRVIFALPFYFLLVNIAAFIGIIESCRGRRYSVWEVASLTRGAEPGRTGSP
jgi:cellulose synthase/poly-beta-1,6-N-acetylglucosamine synthase-like glycosyltransferase